MLRPVLVLSLMLVRSELSSARQTWEKQPEYAEVNPGESVVLQCVINNKEGDCRSDKIQQDIPFLNSKIFLN